MGKQRGARHLDPRELWGCAGLGSLLSIILGGFCSTVFCVACGEASSGVPPLCQIFSILGMCASCPAFLLAARGGIAVPWRAVSRISSAALLIGTACLGAALSRSWSTWTMALLCLVSGAATMCLLAHWFSWLGRICRGREGASCVVALATSCLFAAAACIPIALVWLSGCAWTWVMGACAIPIVAESIAREVTLRPRTITHTPTAHIERGGQTGFPASHHMETEGDDIETGPASQRQYRLAPYSFSLLTSFGMTWGIAGCLVAQHLGGAPTTVPIYLAIIALACITALVMVRRLPGLLDIPFGSIVRVSIAICGVLLALLPLFGEGASTAAPLIGAIVCAMQSLSMSLFAIEACQEAGLDASDVLSTNFIVYGLAGCLSTFVSYECFAHLGTHLAFSVTVFLAMIATAAVIPLLPSKNSAASVFTLDRLPESEDWQTRTISARNNLVARCGLTSREADVLERILRGMSRRAIADEMTLSVWTVRDYTGSIYKKCGVHSAKELMALVGNDV